MTKGYEIILMHRREPAHIKEGKLYIYFKDGNLYCKAKKGGKEEVVQINPLEIGIDYFNSIKVVLESETDRKLSDSDVKALFKITSAKGYPAFESSKSVTTCFTETWIMSTLKHLADSTKAAEKNYIDNYKSDSIGNYISAKLLIGGTTFAAVIVGTYYFVGGAVAASVIAGAVAVDLAAETVHCMRQDSNHVEPAGVTEHHD